MFTTRAMNTYPPARPLGIFDVDLRYLVRERHAAAIGQPVVNGWQTQRAFPAETIDSLTQPYIT